MAWLTATPWLRTDTLGGVAVLRAIQAVHGPVLDRFFIAATMLGSEEFYLLIIPILYWCVDRELGRRVGRLFLFSSFLNVWAKGLFHTFRPSKTAVRVIFAQSGGGFAFPSGHAQGAATFWGYLSFRFRRRWFSLLAVLLVALVGVSRLYLGVHWPVDVFGGATLGFLVALLWQGAGRWWDEELAMVVWPIRAAGAVLFPLLLLLLDRSPTAVKLAGVLAGFSGSAVLAEEWLRVPKSERLGQQVLKVLFGLVGLFLLRAGLKTILPAGLVYDGVRYGVMGVWVGLLVPWLSGWFWPAANGGR
jgi:membrane-associated phospholipid phosphatase